MERSTSSPRSPPSCPGGTRARGRVQLTIASSLWLGSNRATSATARRSSVQQLCQSSLAFPQLNGGDRTASAPVATQTPLPPTLSSGVDECKPVRSLYPRALELWKTHCGRGEFRRVGCAKSINRREHTAQAAMLFRGPRLSGGCRRRLLAGRALSWACPMRAGRAGTRLRLRQPSTATRGDISESRLAAAPAIRCLRRPSTRQT